MVLTGKNFFVNIILTLFGGKNPRKAEADLGFLLTCMAKTLANLEAATRTYLDEAIAGDWTDAEVDREINVGYHMLVTAVVNVFEDYYLTSATADSVANQQEYALPTDIYKIRRVEINYSPSNPNSVPQRALPINIDSVRRDLANTTLGISVLRNPAYYIKGSVIGFIPIPQESGTDNIKIWYITTKDDLVNPTDTIDIPYPDRYGHLIPLYAAGTLLRKGQQEETVAARYLAEFEAGLLKMQQELEDRVAEEGKYVVDVLAENLDFGDFSSLW